MAQNSVDTDAIILDCIDHGESDLIVTLFCRNQGRVTAIAKGAKKSKKRFVNKLELFTFLRISYQQKNTQSLAFLAEADIHTSFLNLRKNLILYTTASVVREFLLIAMREGEADIKAFQLSLWALHHLNLAAQPQAVLAFFLVRFFDCVGYRPALENCHICNSPVSIDISYSFDTIGGGLICPSCSNRGQRAIPVSSGTVKLLHAAQDQPLEKLHRLKLSGTLLREALTLLHSYGRQLFQRDIISWRLLHRSFPGNN